MKRIIFFLLVILSAVFCTAAAIAETIVSTEQYAIGNTIAFGRYAQDGLNDNGSKAIEWIVVSCDEEKALLVSKYCLDSMCFDSEGAYSAEWGDSSLRAWLNDIFLNKAFSREEQSRIAPIHLTDAETEDRVFCLSLDEVNEYLDSDLRKAPYQGGQTKKYNFDQYYYWTRTEGNGSSEIVAISNSGSVRSMPVGENKINVRPAIWLLFDSPVAIEAPELPNELIGEWLYFKADQFGGYHSLLSLFSDGTALLNNNLQKPLKWKAENGILSYTDGKGNDGEFSYEIEDSMLKRIVENDDESIRMPYTRTNQLSSYNVTYSGAYAYCLDAQGCAILLRYTGNEETVEIPAMIDGHPVTELGYGLFAYNTKAKQMIVPDGVTKIGAAAFENCQRLNYVALPVTLQKLGACAFSGCKNIRTLDIPAMVTEIDACTFANCESLKQIVLRPGIESIGEYAFSGCKRMQRIVLPDLCTLGQGIFSGCESLTSLILPVMQTDIPAYFADGCKSLTNVVLSPGVQSIGDCAFRACANLSNMILPEGLKTIGNHAFEGCKGLTTVILPGSLTAMGDSLFENCTGLTMVIASAGNADISDKAFYGCASLTDVMLPFGTTCIGDSAFENCKKLRNVQLPAALNKIGDAAFCACESLAQINWPNSLNEIGSFAFKTTGLVTVNMPGSVKQVGEKAFYYCKNLKNVILNEGLLSVGSGCFALCGELETAVLPESLVNIGSSIFQDCSKLVSVKWPSAATVIPEKTFSGCDSLKAFVFTEGLTEIGASAFDDTALTEALIPATVKVIGDYAFSKTPLTKVTLPDELEVLGSYAFGGAKLPYMILPDHIQKMGKRPFESITMFAAEGTETAKVIWNSQGIWAYKGKDCLFENLFTYIVGRDGRGIITGVKSTVPKLIVPAIINGVRISTIQEKAFYEKSGVEEMIVSEGITKIERNAFESCRNLKIVSLPEGVEHLRENTFYNCANLTTVQLPSTLASIGFSAFEGCSSLGNIEFPEGLTSIGASAFRGCAMEEVVLPDGLSKMDGGVFYENVHLKSISFGRGLTSIPGSTCFACTALENVSLPENLQKIESYAFSGCTALKEVTLPSSVTIADGAFRQTKDIIFHVGDNQAAAQWAQKNGFAFTANASGDAAAVTPAPTPALEILPGIKSLPQEVFGHYHCYFHDEVSHFDFDFYVYPNGLVYLENYPSPAVGRITAVNGLKITIEYYKKTYMGDHMTQLSISHNARAGKYGLQCCYYHILNKVDDDLPPVTIPVTPAPTPVGIIVGNLPGEPSKNGIEPDDPCYRLIGKWDSYFDGETVGYAFFGDGIVYERCKGGYRKGTYTVDGEKIVTSVNGRDMQLTYVEERWGAHIEYHVDSVPIWLNKR